MIEVGYLAGLSPNKRKQGSLLKLVLGGYKTSRPSRRDIPGIRETIRSLLIAQVQLLRSTGTWLLNDLP